MEGGTSNSSLGLSLLGAGYLALVITWVMILPAFAGPDEVHHYVRTLSVSEGRPFDVGVKSRYADAALTPVQARWVNRLARSVDVPVELAPPGFGVIFGQNSTVVQRVNPVGTYQPVPYLLPALVVQAGPAPAGANRLARFASAALCLLCLGLAGAVLWDRRHGIASLIGLFVAGTPMVLFVAAVVNGSGLEIAAGILFLAGVLRLSREARSPAWAWAAAGAGGALLALSRTTGPVWVLLGLGLFAALASPRGVARRAGASRTAALAATVAVTLSVALNRVWEARHGADGGLSFGSVRETGGTGRRALTDVLQSAVGDFGVLEVKLPLLGMVVWAVLVLGLLGLAARAGTRREKTVLAAVVAVAGVATVLMAAGFLHATGYALQGRHVLPFLVAVPLLSADIWLRRGEPARLPGSFVAAVVGVIAAVQFAGVYVTARHFARDPDGGLWFTGGAAWSPPGGWVLWLVVAAAASLAIGTGAMLARRTAAVPGAPVSGEERTGPTRAA